MSVPSPEDAPTIRLAGTHPMPGARSGADAATTQAVEGAGLVPESVPATIGAEVGDAAWSTVFGAPDVGSTPYAIAVDGDDVYLGGDFTGVMAGMPQDTYQRIARWDGRAWSRLGDGLNGTVRAICVVDGVVFAGGEFSVAGGTAAANRLARWDGDRWSDVRGGVSFPVQPMSAVVKALASDGERLYVAGTFDRAGRGDGVVMASGLAAFDLKTEAWLPIGTGLTDLGSPGDGRALLVVGDRLYVGGRFDAAGGIGTGSLASVDVGTGEWSGYGAGIRNGEFVGQVEALAADPSTGAVYVGGSFTAADTVAGSGAVRLDGERFTGLGEFTFFGNPSTASVRALTVVDGRVYAGGEFTTAGASASPNWAVLDGEDWSGPWEPLDNVVTALSAHGPDVVVTGGFMTSGPVRVSHAGIWTPDGWQTFGQGVSYDPYADGNVYAAVSDGDRGTFVGGYFDQAGPVRVGSVAHWTGDRWDAMAGGVAGTLGLGTINGMARLGGDVYATGSFASAGNTAAANIARWDGGRWSAVGSGLNSTGYAIATIGDRLYVGGDFRAAGATAASGVAAWEPGTQSWTALGNAPVYDAKVLGLAVIADRYLVIGGEFTAFRQGNRELVRGLNGLVLFDTQATIDPADPTSGYFLVAGVKRSFGTGTVRGLHVFDGDLYVGGSFDTAGVMEATSPQDGGFAAQNLAVWHFSTDGSWSSPAGADQSVQAFATLSDTELVMTGWFATVGPIRANGIARYEPQSNTWSTFGSGLGDGLRGVRRGEALTHHPALGTWVAGTFNTAGGFPSCSIALWAGSADPVP